MARTRKNSKPVTKNNSALEALLAEAKEAQAKEQAEKAKAREALAQRYEREALEAPRVRVELEEVREEIAAYQERLEAERQGRWAPLPERGPTTEDLLTQAEEVTTWLLGAALRLKGTWADYRPAAEKEAVLKGRLEDLDRLASVRTQRIEAHLKTALGNARRGFEPRNGQLSLTEAITQAESWEPEAWKAEEARVAEEQLEDLRGITQPLKSQFELAKAQLNGHRAKGLSLLGALRAKDVEDKVVEQLARALRMTEYRLGEPDLGLNKDMALGDNVNWSKDQSGYKAPTLGEAGGLLSAMRGKPSSKLRRVVKRWEGERKGSHEAYKAAKAVLLERDKV